MNRLSRYFSLKFIVECRWPSNAYWEVICAWDHEEVAVEYAQAIKNRQPTFRYRVREREARGKWRLVKEVEAS